MLPTSDSRSVWCQSHRYHQAGHQHVRGLQPHQWLSELIMCRPVFRKSRMTAFGPSVIPVAWKAAISNKWRSVCEQSMLPSAGRALQSEENRLYFLCDKIGHLLSLMPNSVILWHFCMKDIIGYLIVWCIWIL